MLPNCVFGPDHHIDQQRNQDFAKGGLENGKFFVTSFLWWMYFRWHWRLLAQSRNFRSPKHKKIKTVRYFILFPIFDLSKWGGVSAHSAPTLVAPLIPTTNFR